jgi:hypothetical protein
VTTLPKVTIVAELGKILNDRLSAEPKQNGGHYVLSEEMDDTVAQWKQSPEKFHSCWLFVVWNVKSVSL